jgi:dienelactone hydrolase
MALSPQLQARAIALRRRLIHALGRKFDPCPPPAGLALSPSESHVAAYPTAPLALSWSKSDRTDPAQWQDAAREKLAELTGFVTSGAAPAVRRTEDREAGAGLGRKSVYLDGGPGRDLPVNLVWQDDGGWPRPVMICLQGTNSGAHMSWGEARMPADPLKIANGGDYARQAAMRGYLAVCLEQACFGERVERRLPSRAGGPCASAAHHALLLGRTLLGERAGDVSVVTTWLRENAADMGVDPEKIFVMGHSAGGSTALFAGALDTRIAGVIAAGCVGFVRDTIAARQDLEGQNVIPGILNWLEIDDVVALCAPRPFLTIAGKSDHIWPFDQAEAVVASARQVYDALGAGERIAALPGPGGHRFYPEIAWDAFAQVSDPRL